jgi:hypothetical protein
VTLDVILCQVLSPLKYLPWAPAGAYIYPAVPAALDEAAVNAVQTQGIFTNALPSLST